MRYNPRQHIARKLAADPTYVPRPVLRPAVWDETTLTETWADRKERLAAERGRS